MATTYEEIIGFLNEEGMNFTDLREERDLLVLRFVDSKDDEMPEVVFIKLKENGELVNFFEPERYKFIEGEHEPEVFKTLLRIQYETKLIQWEHDPKDGEIRACIDLPLEDAKLTKRQLLRCITALVGLMSDYHPRIQQVMETGVDPGPADEKSQQVALLEAMLAELKGQEEAPAGI